MKYWDKIKGIKKLPKTIVKEELKSLSKILLDLGYKLEENQPHISGERVIMSINKLVLVGRNKENKRVVVKCGKDRNKKNEILTEKKIRDYISNLDYTRGNILIPKEISVEKRDGYLFFITEYVEQEKIFVNHSPEEQFHMILRVLDGQEIFHLTTYKHIKEAQKIFNIWDSKKYIKNLKLMIENINKKTNNFTEIKNILRDAQDTVSKNKTTIDTYCCLLIHNDLVPHNFRINDGQIYILDYSSIHFGNKYETLARFINYMLIHNYRLSQRLIKFVKNKGQKEYECLKIMRIYKIVFLLNYYLNLLGETSGNLSELTRVRIKFWSLVLDFLMKDVEISEKDHSEYIKKRDSLRSEEEKERQREFAVA